MAPAAATPTTPLGPPPAHPRPGTAARTATPSRGSPEQVLEPEEANIQGLIRSQMMSILHPVAEHVREVQAQVQQLTKSITMVEGRIDENKVVIDQHHQDILAVQKNVEQTDGRVEKVQAELGLTHREKERLHADHEVTKADLAKIAGNVRTSNVLLKAIQQKTEDLDGDVRALQMGAAKLGRSLLEETEKITQLNEFTEGLNSRHLDLVKDINGLSRSSAETDRSLQKLIHRCEKAEATMQQEVAVLKDHLDSLESRLGGTQHDIQRNMDIIKGIDQQVRLVKSALDHDDSTSRRMDSIRLWQDRTATSLKDNTDSLESLKAAIAALQQATHANKVSADDKFKDMDERILDNTNHLEAMSKTQNLHGDQIKKTDAQQAKLQHGIDVIGEQIDLQQLDLKGVQAAQTDTANKVELQRITLSKTQAGLQHAESEVETNQQTLLQLKDGLAALDVTISKLGTRYDSCTRNIQGVTKGLADVSRHVSQGDHGLLPPKTSPHSRRLLPSLAPGQSSSTVASTPY